MTRGRPGSVTLRLLLLVGCGLAVIAWIRASSAQSDRTFPTADVQARSGPGNPVGPSTDRPPEPVPLSAGWQFLPDPGNVGVDQDWGVTGAPKLTWRGVSIPNDFNPVVSNSGDRGTVGWYKLRFTGPLLTAGRSWKVSFESVRRNAEVWLNGKQLGSSADPYAPFSLPATALIPGAPNLLVVRVDDFRDRGLPEDWWNWGGIMGPVTLEPAGKLSLNDLWVTPELGCGLRCGDLRVQGTLRNNTSSPLRPALLVTVASPTGVVSSFNRPAPLVRPGTTAAIDVRVPVPGPLKLWSPQHPSLYPVRVEVLTPGRVEQTDSVRAGMRSVQVKGGILYLNGQRLWLRGAAIHEDVQGRGAALSDGDIDTIVSELRSVGANVTRAHYLLSSRLLDALDAAGIMVWEQAPVDHADLELQSPSGRAQAWSLLRSTLIGDRNHPSVIVNSVGNELAPAPDSVPGTRAYLDQATSIARQLDPGVPIGIDMYGYPGFARQQAYSKLDVLGLSDYYGWYSGVPGHSIANFSGLGPFLRQMRARYPRQALAISEFGAEALFDGPAATKGSYAFQSDYLRQTFNVIDRLPFMNGAIYWTLREFAVFPGWTGGALLPPGASTDGLHHKGLIAYDGTTKPAFGVAQGVFATVPAFVR